MVDYSTLSIVLTGIGLIVAVTYYTFTIRNQNRTRQAQLLMGLYDKYSSIEFLKQNREIAQQEWTDYEDFKKKYGIENNPDAWGSWQSILSYYNGIGVLLRKKLIDITLVDELLANSVFRDWGRMGEILVEWRKEIIAQNPRKRTHGPFDGFDYLYNELEKYLEEHPELII